MSDSKDLTEGSRPADDEVELTADDLRALSAGSTGDPRKDPRAHSAHSQGTAREPSDSCERGAISRVSLPLGVAIAAIAAAGGLHQHFAERSTGSTSKTNATGFIAQESWATTDPEQDSVRFANPFDATEVFEFPAGTTEAEAQQAIAGFLMERAVSRQARLDGKFKRNR